MNTATQVARDNKASKNENVRRDELITDNYHLIRVIASHMQKSLGVHTELEDLIHAGTMGLFDAAGKYREDKEVPFPLYAKHRIRGAILDSMRQLDWASRDARKQYKQMESVTRELTVQLNRNPTQLEIAEAMGLDARRWQSLMIDFRNFGFAAAQQRNAGNDDQPAKEIPSVPADCPDQVFARAQMRQKLGMAMLKLPERYQQVVKLYYEGDMTMKEIGTALGVNESRVSQIHKCALEKMQSILGTVGVRSSAALC